MSGLLAEIFKRLGRPGKGAAHPAAPALSPERIAELEDDIDRSLCVRRLAREDRRRAAELGAARTRGRAADPIMALRDSIMAGRAR